MSKKKTTSQTCPSRWAGYVRVSTNKQDTDMQRRAIEQRFESDSKSGDTLAMYADKMTGGTMDRPSMQRMLKDIDSGNVQVVCVYALDRISRSMVDGLVEIDKWQKAGVRLVSIKDNIDVRLDDWFGNVAVKIMTTFALSVAESERVRIAQRVNDGIQRRKLQQIEAANLYAKGWTIHKIAARYGVTLSKASKMVEGKLFPGKPKGAVSFDRRKFIRMVEKDYEPSDVCKILGIHRSTYNREMRRLRQERANETTTIEECALALAESRMKEKNLLDKRSVL